MTTRTEPSKPGCNRPEHAFIPLKGTAAHLCAKCGLPAKQHRKRRPRQEHAFVSRLHDIQVSPTDVCEQCGRLRREHRRRTPRTRPKSRPIVQVARPSKKKRVPGRDILGLDGEGQDVPSKTPGAEPDHIYTYLCACRDTLDGEGQVVAEVSNPKGLTMLEVFGFLLSLPKAALKFGYSFGYDLTMMLKELPDELRYQLLRPELRDYRTCHDCMRRWRASLGRECPDCKEPCKPVRRKVRLGPLLHDRGNVSETHSFTGSLDSLNDGVLQVVSDPFGGIDLDYFNGSFAIRRRRRRPTTEKDRLKRKLQGLKPLKHKWETAARTQVWDCFKFFQSSFVESLENWKVGGEQELEQIRNMKALRGEFEHQNPEDVKRYCRRECVLLARMMRKLIDAHGEAGLKLIRFDGAGSTASALLKKHDVGQYKTDWDALPRALQQAILHAFFGGRFELSRLGEVKDCRHSVDIASAYPYAETFLPCMRCGTWKQVFTATEARTVEQGGTATLALVEFSVGQLTRAERERTAWLPLPFRDSKGSICYPCNFSGWAWGPEYFAAKKGWPKLVRFQSAWVYTTECDHEPFAFLPGVYRERVRWGKDGAGIVLKLGSNASYGKTAQGIGDDPPFQDWCWAGMTTATCRAQILEVIVRAMRSPQADPWDIVSVATDGIAMTCAPETLGLGRERGLPQPRDTGTSDLSKPPLGAWEHKDIPEGQFFAKPGLYFRLGRVTRKTIKTNIRARGVGRREIYEQRRRLLDGFKAWDRKDFDYRVPILGRRFFGAKHAVIGFSHCPKCLQRIEDGGNGMHAHPGLSAFERCPTCAKLGVDSYLEFRTQPVLAADGLPVYGRWLKRTTNVSFDPRPKRETVLPRKARGGGYRLLVKDVGGAHSAIYQKGHTTPEGEASRALREFLLEQPDWMTGSLA